MKDKIFIILFFIFPVHSISGQWNNIESQPKHIARQRTF